MESPQSCKETDFCRLCAKDDQLLSLRSERYSLKAWFMKLPLLCLIVTVVPLSAENLFSNADMNTAGGWKGSKKIVDEEKEKEASGITDKSKPNRYLVVTADKKDLETFSQEVETKGVITLNLKFRYKTKDYVGRGLEIRGTRASRDSTFTERKLIADGEWHEMTWEYTQVNGSRIVDFQFSLLQGNGQVCFDDFQVEPNR
jgi:hypothetical protein